jgi:hypothetical protein
VKSECISLHSHFPSSSLPLSTIDSHSKHVLFGLLLGVAASQKITAKLRFPRAFWRQLLDQPLTVRVYVCVRKERQRACVCEHVCFDGYVCLCVCGREREIVCVCV